MRLYQTNIKFYEISYSSTHYRTNMFYYYAGVYINNSNMITCKLE